MIHPARSLLLALMLVLSGCATSYGTRPAPDALVVLCNGTPKECAEVIAWRCRGGHELVETRAWLDLVTPDRWVKHETILVCKE